MGRKNKVVKKDFSDNPHLEGTREEFITKHMRLAYSVGNKHINYAFNHGIEYDDLMSIALEGLIRAYDNYDPTKFEEKEHKVTKFSTYAVPAIKGHIFRIIRDSHTDGIKISRLVKELAGKIGKSEKVYRTIEEVQADFDVSKTYAKEALEFLYGSNRAISLQTPMQDDGTKEATLEEQIGSSDDISDVHANEFLESLSERERLIVDLLIIQGKKQREVAKVIGVTQVQISRILNNIRERAEVFKQYGYANKALGAKAEKVVTKPKKKMTTRKYKPEEARRLEGIMTSKGMDEVLKLLKETDKSYSEIARETGFSTATISYYGKEIRTEEHKERIRKLSGAKSAEKVKAKHKAKKEKPMENEIKEVIQEETTTETSKRKITTSIDLATGGDGLSVKELQSEFARILEIINTTSGDINKFYLQIKIDA